MIHGTMVRYEAPTNKMTIGYWTKVEDWVHWDFEVTKPGTFSVEILQGCGKGSGLSSTPFTTVLKRPEMQSFVSAMQKATGKTPTFWSEAAYTAALIIDKTIQKLEADGMAAADIPDWIRSHGSEFVAMIRKAGKLPVERDTLYNELRVC